MKNRPENAPGEYYVEREGCCEFGLCIDAAPNNFRFSQLADPAPGAFVFKQPGTSEEVQECDRAVTVCPVAVVHDDGETLSA